MFEKIETKFTWQDIDLPSESLNKIRDIEKMLNNYDMEPEINIKPSFSPVFFMGPPGTGKTKTACLLGKHTGRDVYRVDLSLVVSKYIGETEKNLSSLFDKAINKDWILFFDEADALFDKRTSVGDAHDRYENQEVSYLMQRIENYQGLVILASNLKSNIDEAFIRRFKKKIEFTAVEGRSL